MGTDQIQVPSPSTALVVWRQRKSFVGCIDADACNFNPEATLDDGSCEFAEEGFCNCDGQVLDACVEAREVFITVGAQTSPTAIAIATATSSTRLCAVADCAADEDNDGICDDDAFRLYWRCDRPYAAMVQALR